MATTSTRPTSSLGTPVLAGVLHILLFLGAFPPWGLWPLAYLAPVPLAVLALRTRSRVRDFFIIWIIGSAAFLWPLRWLVDVAVVGYPLLAMYLGLLPAMFVWLLARLRPYGGTPRVPGITNIFLIPVLWTGLEMFRGSVFAGGYAWYFIGHPTINAAPLCQTADLLGTYFVSATVLTFTGLAADMLTIPLFRNGKPGLGIRISVGVFCTMQIGTLVYGFARVGQTPDATSPASPTINILAIQTNLEQDNKIGWTVDDQVQDFAHFIDLTYRAAIAWPESQKKPDLIIWPETMVPGFGLNHEAVEEMRRVEELVGLKLNRGTWISATLRRAATELQTPLLLGAHATTDLKYKTVDGQPLDTPGQTEVLADWNTRYNSAFVYRPTGELDPERYDKIHLTPFGEIIPYVDHWPALRDAILNFGPKGMRFDLTAGTTPHRFAIPLDGSAGLEEAIIATPICFESTVPSLCRTLVRPTGEAKAHLLVNMTNDGWFGSVTAGKQRHAQAGRFRCIENRVPMVRVANTGITMAIDSAGRIIEDGPNFPAGAPRALSEGWLVCRMPLDWRTTLYQKVGDSFGWACLALTLAFFVRTLKPGVKRSVKEADSS